MSGIALFSLASLCYLMAAVVPSVEGFADGAPVEACYFMGPNHPNTKSQPPDTLPHKFVSDSGTYKPNEKINGQF